MLTDQSHLVGGQGYCDPNREDQGYAAECESLLRIIDKEYDANKIKFSKGYNTMLPTEQLTKQLRGETSTLIQYDELPYYRTDEQIVKATDVTRDPVTGTITVNHDGHYTGLGLGTESPTFGERLESVFGTPGEKGPDGPRGEPRPVDHNPDGSIVTPDNDHRTEGDRLEDALRKQAFQTFEGNRAQRRRAAATKKNKRTPKHITNTQTKHVKSALGATILTKLGKIQQDTTDTIKREVLKTMPLSRFAEVVGGKEIPEYQKRLLDLQQARAEGSLKHELVSLGEQSAKTLADTMQPLYDHTIATADRYADISEAFYPTLEEKETIVQEVTAAPIQ